MLKTAILIAATFSLSPIARSQQGNLDGLLAKIAKWNLGQSRESMRAISDTVQNAQSPVERLAIETRFLAFLQSDASPGAKDFISRELGPIGSDASVPVLSGMLVRTATSDMARYALERIPGPAADQALRNALGKTADLARIGVINTIGRRRDAAAVRLLYPLATSTHPPTAEAALNALAEIADTAALESLEQISKSMSGPAHRTAAEAWLKAADNRVERGSKAAALPTYQKLLTASEPPMIRAGALRGIIAADPQPVSTLIGTLRGEDLRLQAIAIHALAQTSPKQLLAEIQKLPESGRIRVLESMAQRREVAALPVIVASLKDASKPVRLAALHAIGGAGDASAVAIVAGIAAGDDEADRAVARASLAAIPGKDVDQKIVDDMAGAPPKVRLELIRAAGARGTTAAGSVLIKLTRDADDEVRREAFRALRETASGAEVAGLAALLVSPAKPGDREEAGRALTAALRRSDPARAQEVVSAYTSTADPIARAVFLQTLGPSGNPEALGTLRAGLKDENPDIKRAAIVALAEWPDGTPAMDLLEAARAATNPAHQVLALRGAIKLIGLAAPPLGPQDSVKMLTDAMSLAKQPDEKRAVLAQLPKYSIREALELAKASLNDPQVYGEAKTAANRLEGALGLR